VRIADDLIATSRRIRAETSTDRALGALYGLAIGDALGMPTQELDRVRARIILGSHPGFRDGPAENPISHGLLAGSITDDTMQCVLIANLLVTGRGTIEPQRLADALLAWEREMAERGRSDLLGPSSKRALAAVAAGQDPRLTGRTGTTNGAAMRITPVGIATPAEPLEHLLAAVVSADLVTHDTAVAHAGAAAVAAVVAGGVDGETFEQAAPRAIRAASHFGFGSIFEEALRMRSLDAIVERFGTGVETAESVPTAFGVASLSHGDAWEACTRAAELGGDTDTIAAIAGAMVGACTGLSALPADAVSKVREVNNLDFEPLVDSLLALRRR
jgi:ADP-ribosylglycohydrolase